MDGLSAAISQPDSLPPPPQELHQVRPSLKLALMLTDTQCSSGSPKTAPLELASGGLSHLR